jgi:gamma-glutamyltranspeptidase/glutathione hydrolase
VQAQGGLLTAADLANYEARWHEPLHTEYRGHDVFASAGRYYGGVFSLLGLEIIEHGVLDTSSHYSRVGVDLATLVLTARVAWSQPWLTNDAVLDDREALAEMLSPEKTLPLWQTVQASQPMSTTVQPFPTHSTSLAVVDTDGFVIVGTHSINALPWGEGIFVQGVPLTGGGRWFSTAAPGEARGTPLSHHMVMRDGHLMFASSSWDSSLVEAEFQYLINAIDYDLPADEAASVPRFGYYPWSYTTFETDMDSNWLDPRVSPDVVAEAGSTGLKFTQDGYVDTGRGTLVSFAPDGTTVGANASRGFESPPGAVEYLTNAP